MVNNQPIGICAACHTAVLPLHTTIGRSCSKGHTDIFHKYCGLQFDSCTVCQEPHKISRAKLIESRQVPKSTNEGCCSRFAVALVIAGFAASVFFVSGFVYSKMRGW